MEPLLGAPIEIEGLERYRTSAISLAGCRQHGRMAGQRADRAAVPPCILHPAATSERSGTLVFERFDNRSAQLRFDGSAQNQCSGVLAVHLGTHATSMAR